MHKNEINIKLILAENLATLMQYGNYSQNSLATKMGVSQRSISNYLDSESESYPNLKQVEEIAHFFGLELWQLLVPKLEPTKPPVILSDKAIEALDTLNECFGKKIRE